MANENGVVQVVVNHYNLTVLGGLLADLDAGLHVEVPGLTFVADVQVLAICVPVRIHYEFQTVLLLHEQVFLLVLVENERPDEVEVLAGVVGFDD
jgi:hypothetical protein